MLDDSAYAALCSAVTLQSNEKGFFGDVADDIVEMAGAEWLRHFGGIRSNRERIAECVTNERVKRLVGRMMDNVREVYRGKSATVSKQRRLEAERLRRNGKPDKALAMFTQSVVKAPSAEAEATANGVRGRRSGGGEGDDDRSLALALWGRSAILHERRQMLRCLEDVQLSLRQKLPEESRPEAYSRMAECYASLRRFDQARIAASISSRLNAKGDDGRRQPKANALGGEKDGAQTGAGEGAGPVTVAGAATGTGTETETEMGTETTAASELALAGGEHARLPRVSSKLALARTNEAGRFLVAAEGIRTGDTLVVEDAYVRCLSVQQFGSHCHHCMRGLETAMPCPECSAVAFCSLACRSAALDSYHKFECRYLDLLIGSGMSVLCFAALRIVTQQSVDYFESANLKDEDEDENDDVDADTTDGVHPYGRVYGMVRHERRRCPDDYFRRTLMAVFLTSVLVKSGYLGASLSLQAGRENREAAFGAREMLMARVLLRNLEVLQFNAHEVSETVRVGDATKTRTIGVGLYPSASFFNHECFPAVTRFFRGSTLIVRAVRPVRQGRMVGDCYGPVYDKLDAAERRRRLRARYWFECECQACRRNWPPAQQLGHALRVRCGRCGAAIDEAEATKEKGGRCVECGADAAREYERASSHVDRLRTLLEAATRNATPADVQRICELVEALGRRVRPPHRLYRRAADALTRYWSQPRPLPPAEPCSIEPTRSQ